jgi:hypothetical protein
MLCWGMEVGTIDLDGVRWVVKKAATTDEVARLAHEAAQLRLAAHPGVVEVAASDAGDGVELRTRHAGVSLRQRGQLPAAELCGIGAAVATVLADLHDIGIVHGAVNADHILIGSDGRPMLCGFGASTSTEEGDATLDARGLTSTLSDLLGPDAPRRLVRVLRRDLSVRRGATPARALATALGAAMPDRRLPGPSVTPVIAIARQADPPRVGGAGPAIGPPDPDLPPIGPPDPNLPPLGPADPVLAPLGPPDPVRPPIDRPGLEGGAASRTVARRRHRVLTVVPTRIGVTLLLTVVVVAVLAVGVDRIGGHRRPTTVPCPRVDLGCRPVPVHRGAFVTALGTFTTGLPDPVVVLGRFACGPVSLPAALDPRTGRIWTWLTWPGPTRAVTATAVTAPSAATTLRVRPEASGCDRLEVIDAAGATTELWPGAQRGA